MLLLLYQLLEGINLDTLGANAHNDVTVHLDKAAIHIVTKAGIARFFNKAFDNFVVEAEIEDGFHHTWHGDASSGSHGEQQWIFGVAKLCSHLLLHFDDGGLDLLTQLARIRHLVVVVVGADFRGDGKARWNR